MDFLKMYQYIKKNYAHQPLKMIQWLSTYIVFPFSWSEVQNVVCFDDTSIQLQTDKKVTITFEPKKYTICEYFDKCRLISVYDSFFHKGVVGIVPLSVERDFYFYEKYNSNVKGCCLINPLTQRILYQKELLAWEETKTSYIHQKTEEEEFIRNKVFEKQNAYMYSFDKSKKRINNQEYIVCYETSFDLALPSVKKNGVFMEEKFITKFDEYPTLAFAYSLHNENSFLDVDFHLDIEKQKSNFVLTWFKFYGWQSPTQFDDTFFRSIEIPILNRGKISAREVRWILNNLQGFVPVEYMEFIQNKLIELENDLEKEQKKEVNEDLPLDQYINKPYCDLVQEINLGNMTYQNLLMDDYQRNRERLERKLIRYMTN